MNHRMVTIALPFETARVAAVDEVLSQMGNPPEPAVRAALDAAGIVHFISITAVPHTAPGRAHLVVEASADAQGDPVAAIATALGDAFLRLFDVAGISRGGKSLAEFLAAQDLSLGGDWGRTAGVGFDGSPGLAVQRIRAEAGLARRIAEDMGDVLAGPGRPMEKLQAVRARLRQGGESWAFSAEPTPFLFGGKARTPAVVAEVAVRAALHLGWPLLIVPVLLILLLGLSNGLLATLVLLVAALVVAAVMLRRHETANIPVDDAPDARRLAEVLRHEGLSAQNLLVACSTMQGGWFRRLVLRFSFSMATQGVARVFRPGYLRQIGVIHFARWVLIPGTDKLLFFSNFSDSWESYLEDFISKAADGLTSVWSNTLGFPRTHFLLGGGAADGDRFRRWARRQQMPVLFWYSAYPELKMQRIRLNAAIRRGIAAAETDVEAEDWLSCFGSAPRKPFELDKPDIQTLVFGGLRRMRFSAGVVLGFGDGVGAANAWLRAIEPEVTYGDHVAGHRAMTIAFSAAGLAKLGMLPEELATFGTAFQQGMAAPWRARLLGDVGDQAPEHWLWGADTADAVAYLFARDAERLEALMQRFRADAAAHGHRVVFEQVTQTLPEEGQIYEPFGFADGMSQPVLRDTPRARKARNAGHVVEAGEFVLGYPDSRGFFPSTPTVAPARDPAGVLPQHTADLDGTREAYSSGRSALRDFGRNGTYVVVRQLEQDVAAFQAWTAQAAQRLDAEGRNVWGCPAAELQELVEAKMMGRWKDGRSLVRHARPRARHENRRNANPDNDFLFAREDPQGLECPLGAHIRRANPRDDLDLDGPAQLSISNRHRIIRVGRAYGAAEGGKPGLLFTCLNADIERQFEFIQQTWIGGPNFHGLPNETDPVMGSGERAFTVPTRQGPIRLTGLADFVQMRGGSYFFMPGRSSIRFLAGLAA